MFRNIKVRILNCKASKLEKDLENAKDKKEKSKIRDKMYGLKCKYDKVYGWHKIKKHDNKHYDMLSKKCKGF